MERHAVNTSLVFLPMLLRQSGFIHLTSLGFCYCLGKSLSSKLYRFKLDLYLSNDNKFVCLGKGVEELSQLSSSKTDDERIEECAEVPPISSGKQ